MISPNIPFKLLLMKANFQNHAFDWELMVVNKYPASACETSEVTPVSVITEQRLKYTDKISILILTSISN